MYHSLVKILAAAKLLARSQGATAVEIAENLGIDRRSAYRTIEALEELGYPVAEDERQPHRYRLMEGYGSWKWWVPVPSLSFDVEDAIILDWLFDSVSHVSPLADKALSLRKKLTLIGAATGAALEPKEGGAGKSKHSRTLIEAPLVAKRLSPDSKVTVDSLLAAISKKKICEVSYEARESGEIKTYEIHPLALFESEGGLYCFVLVPRYESIRILAIERIRELVPSDIPFTTPKDFDAEKRLSDPFGFIQDDPIPIIVRFSEDQAPYVKDRDWPESYHFEEDADGRLLMSFESGGIFGLKRWVLSWGNDAEILEPAWLREELRSELATMVGKYESHEYGKGGKDD